MSAVIPSLLSGQALGGGSVKPEAGSEDGRMEASPPAAFKTKVKGRSSLPRPSYSSLNFSYSALTTSLGWVTLMLTMVSPSATSS